MNEQGTCDQIASEQTGPASRPVYTDLIASVERAVAAPPTGLRTDSILMGTGVPNLRATRYSRVSTSCYSLGSAKKVQKSRARPHGTSAQSNR